MGKIQAGGVWNTADLIFSLDAHMFKPHFYVATHLGEKKNKERESVTKFQILLYF